MQTGKYKAVVFDLDGTAVNSHYNIDALQMTCIELLDREATDEELKITYGMTAVNAMRYLGVPEDQLETFGNRWLEHIMRLAKHATLFDGIYPTMCRLHEAGIRLGINTSRRDDELGDLHHYIREPFLELCSVIVTCDKVSNPKPAPDSMLYYCEQTGLAPAQVLFVGDSEFDAGCAQNAGCDFALATWGCFFPDQIPAQYKPQTPQELLISLCASCSPKRGQLFLLPSAIKRPPRKLFRQKGQKTKIFPTCNKTASPEVIKAEGAKNKKQNFFSPLQ